MKNKEPNSLIRKPRDQKNKSLGNKVFSQDQPQQNPRAERKLHERKIEQQIHEKQRKISPSISETHQIEISSKKNRKEQQLIQQRKSLQGRAKNNYSQQDHYKQTKGNANGKHSKQKSSSFQNNNHLHERKCQTPSLANYNYPVKASSKGKQKLSERKKKVQERKQGNDNGNGDRIDNKINNSHSSMQYYYKNYTKNTNADFNSIKGQYSKQRHQNCNHSRKQQHSRNEEPQSHQYKKQEIQNSSNSLLEKQFQSINQNNSKSKKSPFKHKKDRPISNLANARHAKHIEHQLSNLNDSMMKNQESFLNSNKNLNDSLRKNGMQLLNFLEESKKLMKNNQFQKAAKLYQDMLSHSNLNSLEKKRVENIEIVYLFGVCKYHLGLYDEAIKAFTSVLLKDDHYRKNVYLFLAIAYKKINQVDDSLLTLTKAITYFPKYYDAIILRAKILSKQKRYYDSIEDLNKCIKIQPKNLQAYAYKADCLKSIGEFSQAIQIYNEILNITYDGEIMLKRAITFIEFNEIEKALNDLNKIIAKNPANSEAYVFKGQAFTKTKNYNDAILSYEQAIKYNSSKRATTKALHQISKLKIDMGDFYGAAYNMERASSLEVDIKILEKLKAFTEGSTLIMKKKYKRGIENMNFLMKKQHVSQQIKPLIYSFRSYAYFCQYKFSNSLNDLKNVSKMGYKLDSSSQYNQKLLEGIMACQNNNFSQAKQKFQTAAFLRNSFSDPLIYQALTNISQYNRNMNTNFRRGRNTKESKQTFSKSKILLKQAITLIKQSLTKQQNSNSFYILSCLLYTLGQFEDALGFLEKAIDKSDDHVMRHFYLRALIKGMMGKYEDTLSDFNNVFTLAKDAKDKIKERNRSSVRQQSIYNDVDEPEHEKQILQAYLNRAKCYLLFDNKKKAFQDLQTYISCKPLDSQIHTVAGRLLFSIGACQDAVKAYNYSPNITKDNQILLERIKCYIVLKQLNLCLKDMETMIELGDTPIRFDFCCLSALKEASKNTIQSYKEALNKISFADSLGNITNGHIFKNSDMLFYKGLFYFLVGKYEEALKFFTQSKNVKSLKKQLTYIDQKKSEASPPRVRSNYLNQEERFENNIYFFEEIQFNIAVCQLLLGDRRNAVKVLQKYNHFEQLMKSEVSKQQDQGFQQDQAAIEITPFPISSRLCSIFPKVPIPSRKYKLSLSFCLPKALPPEIKFQIQSKIIEDLNMSSTEARPDAPWIKRNSFGVIFTDEVISFDIDINTAKSSIKNLHEGIGNDAIKIDQNQNLSGDQMQRQNQLGQQRQYIDSDEEQFERKADQDWGSNHLGKQQSPKKANIRQFLALDSDIEAKIAKLLKKKEAI